VCNRSTRWPRARVLIFLALGLEPRTATAETFRERKSQPEDLYGSALDRADRAREQGDLAQAIDLFALGYDALPGADRATAMGADLVELVASLVQDGLAQGHRDPAVLAKAIAFIDRHLDDVGRFGVERDVASYEATRDRFRAELEQLTPPEEPTAKPPVEPPNLAPRELVPTTVAHEPAQPSALPLPSAPSLEPAPVVRQRKLTPTVGHRIGLGLTLGGGVLLGTGAALFGYGVWLREQNETYGPPTEDYGCRYEDPTDCVTTIERRIELADDLWTSGIAVAAVGVGIVIAGVVFLVRAKRTR